MRSKRFRHALLLTAALVAPALASDPPMVGRKAPDFSLSTLDGKTVRLADLTAHGPVALIVLRGFPGYQCPYCNRQAREITQQAQAFADRGVHVLMVYPGAAQDLGMHAKEFMDGKMFAANVEMLLDPDFQFTNLYGLRWNAKGETAYPSTFLIDRQGVVFFSKIVMEHGARTTAAELLDALPKPKPM